LPTFFHRGDVIEAETQLLAGVLDDVFGFELLQLGSWGQTRALMARSRTRRQTLLDEAPLPGVVDIVGRCGSLPLQSHSVDAVLLPHTLEFAADPHTVLREAHRVLTGEGQLLILGFRPWSLWGLRAPVHQLLPERRVRDWLAVLGYEIVGAHHYLRRGPLDPRPAGGYLIRARKRLFTLTPLRPRLLRGRRQAVGGLVEPTTRNPS
jgi:SAM-dependent methyltransferase